MATLLEELLIAVEKGNVRVVRRIARSHPDLLMKSDTGATPAYIAAQNGHTSCLNIISQASPESLNLPSKSGTTPAYIAAEKGDINCLAIIAKVVPDSFKTPNKDGNSPALIAAQNGHSACLNIISLVAPDTFVNQNAIDTTPAIAAAQNGHDDCVDIINNVIRNSFITQLMDKGQANNSGDDGKQTKRVFRYWRPSRWADDTNSVGKATVRIIGTYDKNHDKWVISPMLLEIAYKGKWCFVSIIDFKVGVATRSNITKGVVYSYPLFMKGKENVLFFYNNNWYYTLNNISADEAALLVQRKEVFLRAGLIVIVLSLIILLGSRVANSGFLIIIGIVINLLIWFGMTWDVHEKDRNMRLQRENEITQKEREKQNAMELQQKKNSEETLMIWEPDPWCDATRHVVRTAAKLTGSYNWITKEWNNSPFILDLEYDKNNLLGIKLSFQASMDIARNEEKKVVFVSNVSINAGLGFVIIFYYGKDWYYTHEDISAEDAALLIERTIRKKKEKLERIIDNERNLVKAQDSKKHREHIPDSIKQYVWRRDQGRCVKCGSNENLEYDHIIPFSRGGSNTDRNLQLLCEKCNRQKGNRIT